MQEMPIFSDMDGRARILAQGMFSSDSLQATAQG